MNIPHTLQKILKSNILPSEEDRRTLDSFLLHERMTAAVLRAQIGAFDWTSVIKLMDGYLLSTDFIEACAALASPARTLPSEVVAEIFLASVETDGNAIISAKKPPLLLCHICRAWRNVALSTHRLWTSLHIVAPSCGSRLAEINEVVDSWLSRSGVLPLSVSIVRSQPTPYNDISALLETLIRHRSQWKRMRFALGDHLSFKPLTVLSPEDVPLLETVIIDGFGNHDEPPAIEMRHLRFLETPSLREVGVKQPIDVLPLPFPWKNLRHLIFGHHSALTSWGISSEEGLQLLRLCPALESLTIPFGPAPVKFPTASLPLAPLEMECIRCLCVVDVWNLAGIFLQNISTPNLSIFDYTSNPRGSLLRLPILPILSSAHQLQCLRLDVAKATSELLVDCLRLVPTLRELCISKEPSASRARDSEADGAFLIRFNASGDILCPQLRSLKLLRFSALSDTTLLEFMRGRLGSHLGQVRLSSLHVRFFRHEEFEIAPLLHLPPTFILSCITRRGARSDIYLGRTTTHIG
ncbi:hypothetical protein C8R43DRAFT_946864 [Mycena crocata]|nr:hypothetical protein C8R43DRAFT_946864 [Mycena crocata]